MKSPESRRSEAKTGRGLATDCPTALKKWLNGFCDFAIFLVLARPNYLKANSLSISVITNKNQVENTNFVPK